ncbi:BC_2427 family protein [Bacillus toyonensis]|uniref:BC_2427 family protein n=1 Tax=Bacillus toyonensis TaxID=155322 RepID=UPI000CD9AA8B
MKNPWVGQEIWNKVYKGKKLNVQDDAREIRKKEKIEETESEKEDKAFELKKESKKTESKKGDKAIELEKENKETESKKGDKAIELEKESKETESEKDEETIESEKESKETESEKEEETIESEKESKETESKKGDKAIELEKESKETESKKEEETIELEKESKETESEKEEETIESEKESKKTKSKKEEAVKSEKKSKETESQKKRQDSESKIETLVRSKVVKTPFSIISDVTSFIKFPNMNVKNQEVFVFRNQKDERGRELDTKLLTTVQHYQGEVNCNLVSSNLYEKRVLLELSNQKIKSNMEENWVGTSSWIPIHGIILDKEDEGGVNNYIPAKLPIEIGKYKGEINLREKVVFKEKVIEIKEVSQEIILTKKEFLLPKIIRKGNNPSKIEKGSLLVEGYIFQCIEFISERSTPHDNAYQLIQNLVLELTVQLLQEQEVWVRIR